MKPKWKYISLTILLLAALDLQAQLETNRARSQIREGNQAYQKGNFSDSQVAYSKALELKPGDQTAHFNLGDALYRQERYQEAGQEYIQAARIAEDPIEQAQAFHNLGNTFMAQQNYKQSVDAYKEALRRNPRDNDTRYNLAYALQKLQEQQNKQDQENQDQNDQEKEDQQQNEDQQNQEQDQQDQQDQQDSDQNQEDQKQDPSEDQQENGDDQQQGDQQPQPAELQEMSKEEIEKLLENLQYEEDQLLKEISKRKVKHKANPEKDW